MEKSFIISRPMDCFIIYLDFKKFKFSNRLLFEKIKQIKILLCHLILVIHIGHIGFYMTCLKLSCSFLCL